MSAWLDLEAELDEQMMRVHGKRFPLLWRRNPEAPAGEQWRAWIEYPQWLRPTPRVDPTRPQAKGECCLRRLVEAYRAIETPKERAS